LHCRTCPHCSCSCLPLPRPPAQPPTAAALRLRVHCAAGFGAPCVIATSCFSFYVGAAALAVLFPLFILVAMDSEPGAALAGVPAIEQEVGKVSRLGCGGRLLASPRLPAGAGAAGWCAAAGAGARSLWQLISLR
jgi:hypothetical protein